MRILNDERGQAAILLAVFLALTALGFMALAIDTGYFLHEKRMAQVAADAAAIAATEEFTSGNSGNMQTVANAMANLNGFNTTLAKYPASVAINTPPLYGTYAGSSNYIEAIVTRPVPTLLLGAFSPTRSTMTVSARAVAGGGQNAPTCSPFPAPNIRPRARPTPPAQAA